MQDSFFLVIEFILRIKARRRVERLQLLSRILFEVFLSEYVLDLVVEADVVDHELVAWHLVVIF